MKVLIVLCLAALACAQDDGYGRPPAPAPAPRPAPRPVPRPQPQPQPQPTQDQGYGPAPPRPPAPAPRPVPKPSAPRPSGGYGGGSSGGMSSAEIIIQQQIQQQQAQVQTMTGAEAANAAIMAAVAQGANKNNFGIQTNAQYTIATSKNVQNPVVWDALDLIRGKAALSMEEILNLMATAVAGTDYPAFNDIPDTSFSCESVKQAGYYADTEAQCQVIRRCDINGVMWSYLCPNMTLFNQITLVCDYFFNIDCSKATQFYDYSNPRLYTEFNLLDDGEYAGAAQSQQNTYQSNQGGGNMQTGGYAQPSAPKPAPRPRPSAPTPTGDQGYAPPAPVPRPAPRPQPRPVPRPNPAPRPVPAPTGDQGYAPPAPAPAPRPSPY